MAWLLVGVVGVLDRFIRTFFVGRQYLQLSSTIGVTGMWWAAMSFVLLLVVLIATIRWYRQHHRTMALAGLVIIVGGVNNIVDIVLSGGVVDYWSVQHPWGEFWFNAADGMIIVGVITLIYRWHSNSGRHLEISHRPRAGSRTLREN